MPSGLGLGLVVSEQILNPRERIFQFDFDKQVKKRVDGCEIRSKKGDTLHIHYIGSLQVTWFPSELSSIILEQN